MMGHAAGWSSANNNSHSHREIVLTLGTVLSSLGSILMILRFYTYFYLIRRRGGQALAWATLSWILAALSTAFYCAYPYHPHLRLSRVLATTADLLAYWGMAFTKIAMTMYILHLQEGIYKVGKWVLLVASGLNVATAIGLTLVGVLQCHPGTQKTAVCAEREIFGSAWAAAWSVITDLLLLIYPVVIMWNRQIRTTQKILICLLLSLGTIGTIVCISNLIVSILHKGGMGLTLALNIIEIWSVLISLSAAPLWPLFKVLCQTSRISDTFGALKERIRRNGLKGHRKERSGSSDAILEREMSM